MLISTADMLSQRSMKLFGSALHFDSLSAFLIFGPKLDALLPNVSNAMLRDWRAPYITSSVAQKLLTRFERLNFNDPPACTMFREHCFHLLKDHLHSELVWSESLCSKII